LSFVPASSIWARASRPARSASIRRLHASTISAEMPERCDLLVLKAARSGTAHGHGAKAVRMPVGAAQSLSGLAVQFGRHDPELRILRLPL
jgi:hypothetical protein